MVMTSEQFLTWGGELGRMRKVSQMSSRKEEPLRGICGMRTNTPKTAVVSKMLQHNSHPLEVKKTGFLLSRLRYLVSHVCSQMVSFRAAIQQNL